MHSAQRGSRQTLIGVKVSIMIEIIRSYDLVYCSKIYHHALVINAKPKPLSSCTNSVRQTKLKARLKWVGNLVNKDRDKTEQIIQQSRVTHHNHEITHKYTRLQCQTLESDQFYTVFYFTNMPCNLYPEEHAIYTWDRLLCVKIR